MHDGKKIDKRPLLSSLLVLPIVVAVGLFCAIFLSFFGYKQLANGLLFVLIVVGSLPLVVGMIRNVARGVFGVDVVALCALVGSLLLHEYIAGAVILLMLSGGEALEVYALSRASRQLSHLLSRAPKIAHLKREGGVDDVDVASVNVSDLLVVTSGEVVPVDGVVDEGVALLDESALTGEAMPVEKKKYMHVLSGSVLIGQAFVLKATKNSDESAYGRIVELVKQASESRAPIVRMADKYAVFFNLATLFFALGAWFFSGVPERVLAVLVVATPCPLILAVPIAVMSAISAAARRGVVVKDGSALETLAKVKTFLFDKTGTVTFGVPEVLGVRIFSEKNEGSGFTEDGVLRFAAALEQLSSHPIAKSIRNEATSRGIILPYPDKVKEDIGRGVKGVVDGEDVIVGTLGYLHEQGVAIFKNAEAEYAVLREKGEMAVMVAVNEKLVGMVLLGDVVREEAKLVMQDLRKMGVKNIAMVTGDRKNNAVRVASALGIQVACAECSPEQKVDEVRRLRKKASPIAMVGDGINDAPALAVADVGIAMTSRGETAATDAADIVITVDSVERSRDVFVIAQHMYRVAREGIFFGIGASIFLMFLAALGYIPPVQGALLQEVIDVIVIVNALRVLRPREKN